MERIAVRNVALLSGLAFLALWTMSCGNGAVPGGGDGPPVAVSITPQSSSIAPGQGVQFAATVTGLADTQVNWLVDSVSGGNATAGVINASGYYTAPAGAQAEVVMVQAVSQGNPAASATASVTVSGAGPVSGTNNPQVANYAFTPTGAATVFVEFGTDTTYGLRTASQAVPGGQQVNILVAGMRAFTTYHMRAVAQYSDGTTFYDADHTFTTGGLPSDRIPQVQVNTTAGSTPNPGVELLSLDGNTGSCANCVDVAAEDLQGNLIWYYDSGLPAGVDPDPVKLLPDGHVLINFSSGAVDGQSSDLREIDLAGNIVWEMTAAQLNQALAAAGFNLVVVGTHHDFTVLPNGHLILIASTYKSLAGLTGYSGTTQVLGDVLIDLDQNHVPDWVWSTFDHLDANRHPMSFPDWTHSNCILYSPDDGDLILSMRHQNWIIKLDYNDGHGSGNILWRLGEGGDFTLQGGTDPIDWEYAQHAALLFGANSAGVFQLGMFDNGNDRIIDSSGDVCGVSGHAACYSRVPIFQLDETSKTADIVWQDKLPVFSDFGGYFQPLANGDVEFDEAQPTTATQTSDVYEVTKTSSPQVVWRMTITDQNAYRAFRVPSLYPGVQW